MRPWTLRADAQRETTAAGGGEPRRRSVTGPFVYIGTNKIKEGKVEIFNRARRDKKEANIDGALTLLREMMG